MNIPVVSEDNPLRNWADPSRELEEVVPSFAKMRGDHDAARREEINAKAGDKARKQQRYMRLLQQARSENFSDLMSMNAIFHAGTDSLGRAVVCVNGKHFLPSEIDRNRIIQFFALYMDSIASREYVVVYFNAEATSDNHPDLALIKAFYDSLHPKYSRNLRLFYLVHPSWWVKFTVSVMNTIFQSDIREKMKNVESLAELFQNIPFQQLKVPDYVLAHDKKVAGGVAMVTDGSSKQLHDNL